MAHGYLESAGVNSILHIDAAGGMDVGLTFVHPARIVAGVAGGGEGFYVVEPGSPEGYVAVVSERRSMTGLPRVVLHLWGVTGAGPPEEDQAQELGFYSLLYLAQALGTVDLPEPVRIAVVTDGVHDVTGQEPLFPEKATVLGPCQVIPQEYANVSCRNIDRAVSGAPPAAGPDHAGVADG